MTMTRIKNEKALTDIFGRWPSFHDAEIISIYLDRSGQDGPSLEAKIHLFEMTNRVDAKGYYVLKNHILVTFRFRAYPKNGRANQGCLNLVLEKLSRGIQDRPADNMGDS
jgi:hypothetical protein